MPSTTYAMPDARVTVVCEVPGHAEWLDELLPPGLNPVEFDPNAVTVVVHEASGDKHRESTAFPLGPVPCFVFEHEVISYDAWRVGDHIVIVDEKYDARYEIGPTMVRVGLRSPAPETRPPVLRVVRELALAQTLASGQRVLLHASGLEAGGRVVLFTGPKEAGKTTLVARLASTTGAGFLSNDCALMTPIAARSGGWDVRTVPLTVSVRADTVRRLPQLFARVPAIRRPSRLTETEAEAAVSEHGTMTEPARLRLSPIQFARALDVPLSVGGELAALAFVTIDPKLTGFRIAPLAAADARQPVRTAVYGPRGASAHHTVFEQFLGTRRLPSADARMAEQLAAEANCVDLRVGPAVLEDDSVARDLLAALMAGT